MIKNLFKLKQFVHTWLLYLHHYNQELLHVNVGHLCLHWGDIDLNPMTILNWVICLYFIKCTDLYMLQMLDSSYLSDLQMSSVIQQVCLFAFDSLLWNRILFNFDEFSFIYSIFFAYYAFNTFPKARWWRMKIVSFWEI